MFFELIEMSVACRGLVDGNPVREPGQHTSRVFGQRVQEEAITADACDELGTSVAKRSDLCAFTHQHQSNQPVRTQWEFHHSREADNPGKLM